MGHQTSTDASLDKLMTSIDYKFDDTELLRLAMTHSSYSKNGVRTQSNQLLEFLGDRVLGLIVASILLEKYPNEVEGDISRRHASLVRTETLAGIGNDLHLGQYIRLSKGEDLGGGRDNPALLADTCEALIAAIYRDGGLKAASVFVNKFWGPLINVSNKPPVDAKTMLQEWAQKQGLPIPRYCEIDKKGPDHEPVFMISVEVEGHGIAKQSGSSKRVAEQKAADKMLSTLSKLKEL